MNFFHRQQIVLEEDNDGASEYKAVEMSITEALPSKFREHRINCTGDYENSLRVRMQLCMVSCSIRQVVT